MNDIKSTSNLKTLKLFLATAFVLTCGLLSSNAIANAPANVSDQAIEAAEFVDEASATSIAEVEAAKLALEKSESPEVKKFAQLMINNHVAANNELASIARSKNLDVEDEATLTTKAKELALKQHSGESFDVAYAKNQVAAHEDAIELFEKATKSPDAEISTLARTSLPKLKRHLELAHQLLANATTAKQQKS